MRKEYTHEDTPEMIQMCQECPFPECVDCLGSQSIYGYAVRYYFATKEEPYNRERIDDYIKRRAYLSRTV